MIDSLLQRYAFFALAAAALFGVSAPLAKLLVAGMPPLLLAGLLYLGSGVYLALLRGWRRFNRDSAAPPGETALAGRDYAWLAAAILCGGMLAPVLLVWGLTGLAAASASLLLSSESVLTALIAALLFREAVGPRIWLAAALLCAASLALAYDPREGASLSLHALAILAACALWGLDNNLTRQISSADPVAIAMAKGLSAGSVNCALALALGATLPGPGPLAASLALGAASYGVSLVLYILALRHLGSARTGAHFSTAPFFGAVFAVAVLGEPVTITLAVALALTIVATWLVLTEKHAHQHVHAYLEHAHRHARDTHHQHAHDGSEGPEPHAHLHVHPPLTHTHPHLPDLHHRHGH